jgi:hypothetical protein
MSNVYPVKIYFTWGVDRPLDPHEAAGGKWLQKVGCGRIFKLVGK